MTYSLIKRYTRGSSLIEFALLLPVFVTLMLGTFEIGWALFIQNTLVDVARESARVAATENVNFATVQSTAQTMLTNSNLPGNKLTVSISPIAFNTQLKGTPITVTVALPYKDVSILPSALYLGKTVISAQVTMAKEY